MGPALVVHQAPNAAQSPCEIAPLLQVPMRPLFADGRHTVVAPLAGQNTEMQRNPRSSLTQVAPYGAQSPLPQLASTMTDPSQCGVHPCWPTNCCKAPSVPFHLSWSTLPAMPGIDPVLVYCQNAQVLHGVAIFGQQLQYCACQSGLPDCALLLTLSIQK